MNSFIRMERGGSRMAMDFGRAEGIGRQVEKEFSRDMGKYEEGKCPEFVIDLRQAVPGSHKTLT